MPLRVPQTSIVSLLPSATELLFAIGAGVDVVAVSDQCDYPPCVSALERVTSSNVDSTHSSRDIDTATRARIDQGQSLYNLDRERIATLRPNLIVTQSQCEVCAVRHSDVVELVESDSRLNHTEVLALNPTSLDEVLKDALRLGIACGRQSAAQDLVADMRRRISQVANLSSAIARANRPSTICIEWFEPLMTAGNWIPELVTSAGGISLLADAGAPSQYAKWQEVLAMDPDTIVLMPCGFSLERVLQSKGEVTGQPGWGELRATQNRRVFAVDGSAYFLRSGPRLVDSLEMLIQILHPSLASASAIPKHQHAWSALG
jgi:iron complex transport system substrate-binding protein